MQSWPGGGTRGKGGLGDLDAGLEGLRQELLLHEACKDAEVDWCGEVEAFDGRIDDTCDVIDVLCRGPGGGGFDFPGGGDVLGFIEDLFERVEPQWSSLWCVRHADAPFVTV